MRRIYVKAPTESTDQARMAAAEFGATEVWSAITPRLAALGIESFGLHEIPEPPPPPSAAPSAEDKLTAARDALSVLDVIEAPVTAADLADVLVDVKIALEG